jgi:predicted transcriptional regulator
MPNIFEHVMSLKEIQTILNTPKIGINDLMKCTLGAKTSEITAYCLLVNEGPLNIKKASELMGKSRSTVQRLLQGLVEKGLAYREEELIGLGGYQYLYHAIPPEQIRVAIKKMLDKWYKLMLKELEDLPGKIDERECPKIQ